MEITGKKFGETWVLDEQLRMVAEELAAEFTDGLGHINLERVVFVRQRGLKGSAAKWAGKCYYFKEPYSILFKYTLKWMVDRGLENAARFEELLEADMLDIRYIIALNEDVLPSIPGEPEEIEKALLHHELLHIKLEMDGIEEHDAKDFKEIMNLYGVYWADGGFKLGTPVTGGESS